MKNLPIRVPINLSYFAKGKIDAPGYEYLTTAMIHILRQGRSMLIIILTAFITGSCDDFIDIPPPKNQIVNSAGYTDDATAIAAVRGIYSQMNTNLTIMNLGVAFYGGLSSDELINHSTSQTQVEIGNNNITQTNADIQGLWDSGYKFIYYCNALLEGLENSANVTDDTRNQLEGEAKFIRAFVHFQLVNLFGNIPYITTTNYRVNQLVSRQPISDVYQNIISDLKDSESKLDPDYVTAERTRPNRWTASSLLSRVYLYTGDWANSEAQATSVIDNSNTYSLTSLDQVFKSNNTEAIWQLKPVQPSRNSRAGATFILTFAPPFNVSLNPALLSDVEMSDNRKTAWIGSVADASQTYYFPYKYKVRISSTLTEYDVILRLAEQYLIRAEARAQQDDLEGAIADMDAIRNRAGLPLISDTSPSISKSDVLVAIELERKIELFAEGHRWFDLKRWNRADIILSALKADWQSTDVYYPIPQTEIDNNPNMSQNPGY